MENKSLSNSYIIGISGGSGSGKTTFVRTLAKNISSDLVTVLSMDNYYFPREKQIEDDEGVKNFDLLSSIDIPSFIRDLKLLMSGEEIVKTEYVFNNKESIPETIVVRPAPVILVEGLFVFSVPELFNLIDLKIIIEAKDVIKVIRRIHRDKVERNYPVEDVIYRYQHHVLPSYEQYIQPYIDQVDLVINNNDNFDTALNMIEHHIRMKAAE